MSKRFELQRPQINSTTMVQEIVAILKNPPFNETLTLLSFEEKKEYELLDLIVKILGMIDPKFNIDQNDTGACLKATMEFLVTLNFQYSSQQQLQDDLSRGDKRLLIKILHFFLTNLEVHKKQYHINKYTSELKISEEYKNEEEIMQLYGEYKELQSEFLSTFEMLEEKKVNAPQINEIKEDIKKNQSDKLQLTQSIARFKEKYSGRADFLALLDMTSKLRKEQENDSVLEKKINKQQYDLKEAEEKLLIEHQRLLDNKKNLSDNVSALMLLDDIRQQRNNNRDAYENLSKYELGERKSKIKVMEDIIRMPDITINDLSDMKQTRITLINDIDKLENKLKNSPIQSSELQIHKQNALQATKQKEISEKNLLRLEKEKVMLEVKFVELKKKFECSKGFKYVKKNDLLQQALNLKKKKDIYNQCLKVIDRIKGEALILDRTISILRDKTPEGDDIVRKFEEKNGKLLNQAKRELEQLASKKQEIDETKALTLEGYSNLIQEMKKKLNDQEKKNVLAPLAEERDKLKKEFEQIQPSYEKKKRDFQNATSELQKGYDITKENFIQAEKVYRDCQDKYHQLHMQMCINEALLKRCEEESLFVSRDDKRLNENFKNYQEYYKEIIQSEEGLIKELREKQYKTKAAYEDNDRQLKMYNDMKKLLQVKLEVVKKK